MSSPGPANSTASHPPAITPPPAPPPGASAQPPAATAPPPATVPLPASPTLPAAANLSDLKLAFTEWIIPPVTAPAPAPATNPPPAPATNPPPADATPSSPLPPSPPSGITTPKDIPRSPLPPSPPSGSRWPFDIWPLPPSGDDSSPTPPADATLPSPLPPSLPSGSTPPAGSSQLRPSRPHISPPLPAPSGGGGSPSSGVATGLFVGLAIGGGVAILVISISLYLFCKKKRRRPSDYHIPPPSPPPKVDHYAVPVQHQWQPNPPQRADHVCQQFSPPPRPPAHFSNRLLVYEFVPNNNLEFHLHGKGRPVMEWPIQLRIPLGAAKGLAYLHDDCVAIGGVAILLVLSLLFLFCKKKRRRPSDYYIPPSPPLPKVGIDRLLIYEFAPNNTLEFHLHGKGRPVMEFAIGAAKGLNEDCHAKIIHRDIKASNILLDFNFEAKVSDFGLAKTASDNNTHVSTRVVGAFGYLAPEYAASGKVTDKSDVFCFSVLLLELITGRRLADMTKPYIDKLVNWARPLLTRVPDKGNFDSLIDRRLGNNNNQNELAHMVACAAACVRHSARRRPRLGQMVRALEGYVPLTDLNEGIRPGHSAFDGSYGSSDYDADRLQYNEDMIRLRKTAFGMQEYSGISSGPTSEYGLNPSSSSSEGLKQQTKEIEK